MGQIQRGTIAVIDDDRAALSSMARMLSVQGYCTATFDSPFAFLDQVETLEPNCIVADLSMPEISGLELQRELVNRNVLHPLIFVTGHADIRASVTAIRGGAVDFLTKPFDHDVFLAAIKRALKYDVAKRGEFERRATIARCLGKLTPREREVYEQVVQGLMNKQIAAQLGITEKTVKVHRARVMQKMQCRSVAQLARIAERIEHHAAYQ